LRRPPPLWAIFAARDVNLHKRCASFETAASQLPQDEENSEWHLQSPSS
jgi:hypothetical protein